MSNDTQKTILAKMLIKLRKAHKLTQEQVANILKVKRSTYAYYERNVIPSPENISRLALIFNVSVHELMFGAPDPHDFPIPNNLGSPKPEVDNFQPNLSLNNQERTLMSHYRLLPDNLKDKVFKDILDLADKLLND